MVMTKPILKGPRVTLRPIKLSDAPQYVRWFKDADAIKFMSIAPDMTLAKEKKYIKGVMANKHDYNWSVEVDGKHIGSTEIIVDPHGQDAIFGIFLGEKNEWGKGYASECLNLVCKFLFEKLKFNRLYLKVFVRNSRAVKTYRKFGFVKEGLLRQEKFLPRTGRFEDGYIMSILRSEWLKKKKNNL